MEGSGCAVRRLDQPVAVQRSDFRRLVERGGAQALIQSLNQKTTELSGRRTDLTHNQAR